MRVPKSLTPCLILLALASPVAAQDGEASAKRSTRDGVFSAAQAQRGKTLYGNVCAVRAPEDLLVVVAGGPEPYHICYCPNFADTWAVTKRVVPPA